MTTEKLKPLDMSFDEALTRLARVPKSSASKEKKELAETTNTKENTVALVSNPRRPASKKTG